ncbi:MAG TPA: SUMF1/EgtB/PvdO family nonheme iron enzyme [Anaerolineae bacterium]|nr:SUMF1/EgtB/PvdO family nonheme iron enzyme [Anaerolineae bacterium]
MKRRNQVVQCFVTVLLLCACNPRPPAPHATGSAPYMLVSPASSATGSLSTAEVRVREIDGAEMIFVPAGEFIMGSDSPDDVEVQPQHQVHVDAFWIDRTEVTNQQYERCVDAGACAPSTCADDIRFNDAKQPVVCVSWYDAAQYARWAGGRLPTEAEWEKAARGTDGRQYPWGDEFYSERANTWETGILRSTPVGQYSPLGDSPYGATDMAGNVYEWTSTEFKEYPYDSDDGREDPQATGPRVIRGGSFLLNRNAAYCAARAPAGPGARSVSAGFRVAVSAGSLD